MSPVAAFALAAALAAAPGTDVPPAPEATTAAETPPVTIDGAAPVFRIALLAEGAASAWYAERSQLVLGGRVTVRLGPGAFVLSLDAPPERTGPQPRMLALLLGGPGGARDLSPRFGVHGALLVGLESVDLDDYVDGHAREFLLLAGGTRVGLEWRGRSRGSGPTGLAPVVGLSATLLYVESGSDRLRGIEWGGFTALLSLTVGGEFAQPPREPRTEAPALAL